MGIIKAVNLVFDYIRRDEQENVESVNRALDHVNIDIKEGDFVAILGHNGSGKSTFAKHVNGDVYKRQVLHTWLVFQVLIYQERNASRSV